MEKTKAWHAVCYITGQEKQVPASSAARHNNNSAARMTDAHHNNANSVGECRYRHETNKNN